MTENVIKILTESKEHWDEINSPELLIKIFPNDVSLDMNQANSEIKNKLLDEIKQLQERFHDGIPKEEGIKLINLYIDSFNTLCQSSKLISNSTNILSNNLVVITDPLPVLQTSIDQLKSLPDLDPMISQLKSDVQNELSKNKKVSQLTETLNQLKRECDEQVEIATRSAQSQALVDYEFSLSKYKEELLDSQLSLKSVETSIASLTEQRNCVIEILHQKESEVDTAISMRNDRLEAYENELQEAEFQLEEAKRKLLESNQQKISLKDLQRKLDDENKKLSEISLKENEYIKMIDNKNEEISKLKEKISLLKHEVETYTQTLEQLPSINEWENAKIKLEHVRTSFNTESEKNNLQKTYSMNLKQFEKLKEKKKELELNNKNIKEKIEKEKYEINNFIDENNFENCSELISMLTKQKKSLKQKCDAIEYQISQMITNTSIQRKEKENFEKELSNLKRQISTFAMKDPESLKYEILDENDGESKRKRNITKRIQKTCEKIELLDWYQSYI